MPTVVDSPTLFNEFIKDQKDRHAAPELHRGYTFPIPWFMQRTGGWGRSMLCYVYGQAGSGKTSVLSTAATQFGRDKTRFLYISLEEPLFTVAERIISNLENINRTHFRDICIAQTEWPLVYHAAQIGAGFQGYWAWAAYTEAEITQVVKDVNPDVIMLDYLQLTEFPGQNMMEQVKASSQFLVKLRKGSITGRKHCVIAAAQLNDQNKVFGSRGPDKDGDLIVEISSIDNGNGGVLPDRKRLSIRKARYGVGDSTEVGFFGGRSMVGQLTSGANYGPIPKP